MHWPGRCLYADRGIRNFCGLVFKGQFLTSRSITEYHTVFRFPFSV
jgi:hypothetical protein